MNKFSCFIFVFLWSLAVGLQTKTNFSKFEVFRKFEIGKRVVFSRALHGKFTAVFTAVRLTMGIPWSRAIMYRTV